MREHPREPFTIAEGKTVFRELTTRAREDARRRGLQQGEELALVRTDLHDILIDGRHVLNPVGFAGRSVVFAANHTVLTREGERLVRLIEEAFPADIVPMLRDHLALRLGSEAMHPDAAIVLDREETSVFLLRDGAVRKRAVLAIGSESASSSLARALHLGSLAEASRMLDAAAKGMMSVALRRRVERALAPVLLRWAAIVAASLGTMAEYARPHVRLLALDRWQPPFRAATEPRLLRRLFSNVRAARWSSATIRDLCRAPDDATTDDVIALAAMRSAPTRFHAAF